MLRSRGRTVCKSPGLACLVLAAICARGATAHLDLESTVSKLRAAVNADEAMTYMRTIYSTDRYFTFSAFQKTAEYLRRTMDAIGLERTEIVHAPADGVTQVGFWTMPLAWDVESARLAIMNRDVPAEQRVLADYEQVPASLGMWSGATPPDGIETDVVAVSRENLRNLEHLNIRGKLVLMDVNPAGHKWLLAKAGALGAINAFTENPDLQDGRQWINAWGDSGWGYTKRSTPLLSFSITPRQADLLRTLLARGPVRVKATVNTRFYEGSYPYVTGILRGTGDEEVLVLAHTSEQGANDNATGVAASLEAVATLNRLISEGKLPQPQRSIRVLLMGEMYGSMHYVALNPERIRKTIAAICVDTPAASYDLAGTEFTFHMNPHVAKDFTDALILKVASAYFPSVHRPWHEKQFTTGTDTYLAEPMVGVPTVWSYSGTGVETHHNSEDTPDRVDARSLRDLSVVTAAFLYTIANASEPEARWLAQLSETRGYGQILKHIEDPVDTVTHAKNPEELRRLLSATVERITYSVGRESQAVSSVLRLVPDMQRASLRRDLAPMLKRLEQFGEEQRSRVTAAADDRLKTLGGKGPVPSGQELRPNQSVASKIVVKRKRFGTVPLDDIPHEEWEGQPSGAWAAVPTIALYWCDGRRDLAEVIRLTELELGPTKFDFVSYFRFLRKKGYVDFVEEGNR